MVAEQQTELNAQKDRTPVRLKMIEVVTRQPLIGFVEHRIYPVMCVLLFFTVGCVCFFQLYIIVICVSVSILNSHVTTNMT